MEFILASSNAHKAQEFSLLFNDSSIDVLAADEKLEVVEDGSTFNENAYLKAQAYFKKFKRPIMSDDSGLVVEALTGELGIHSARFGGKRLLDRERAELLLQRMEGKSDRRAYFHCSLCFYLSDDEIYFFEGRLAGEISLEYLGDAGFGYDPVFIPEELKGEGLTLAQAPEWKEKNSHRAQACRFATNFWAKQ